MIKKFVTALVLAAVGSTAQAQINFFKGSWDDLVVEARKTGKPYFIDFWAPWCGPCKMLNNTTFKDKQVGEFAGQNFIAYKLNTDEPGDGQMLAGQHRISSIPTILFFSPDGKVMGRETGYQNAAQFLMTMQKYVPAVKSKKGKAGTGQTGDASSSSFQDYLELKDKELQRHRAELIGTDTSLNKLLTQAGELGKRKEDLLFDDLKAQVPKTAGADFDKIMDAEFYLGMKDFKKVVEIINPLFENNKIAQPVLYYFAAQFLRLPEGQAVPHEPMRWINQLVRNQPDNLAYIDTKLALLFKDKKESRAAELVKEYRKQNLKPESDTPAGVMFELSGSKPF